EKAKTDPKLQELVETREKAMLDYTNDIACAEDRGKLKGKAEGKAEGKVEGKIETARAMLSKGMSVEIISECTGLSIDEIKAIN
ncbi:MAG: hypothetical protein LBB21_05535, partial [Holosporaceae bacterium]|nr:hypothetical protein [Holosporaceae bacterium]